MYRNTLIVLLLTTAFWSVDCYADSPGELKLEELLGRETVVIPLWPGDGTPPSKARKTSGETVQDSKSGKPGIRNVETPSMIFVPASTGKNADGTTILFAPGGGYGSLSLPNAVDICNWAGAIGAHCAVLKYRVPRNPDDPGRRIPLSDAQRAVRLLRADASKRGVDVGKIIMIGSSAGGHLAFNLANNHGEPTYPAIDDADQLSARPDAVVLMYPAYLTQPTTSMDADSHLNVDQLSPKRTPPIFMTVTRPDKFTWGAVNTMLKLKQAKVPAELHVYPEGGHGGCFDKYPLMEFVRPAARFLKDQSVISESAVTASDEFLNQLEATFLDRSSSGENKRAGKQVASTERLAEAEWSVADHKLAALRDPAPEVYPIWPNDGKRNDDPDVDLTEELLERPDGLVRITNVTRPTLHAWRPEHPDGRAVVVFPGGAYNVLAAQHEGTDIAQWLNGQGITAFIAKYRVPRRKGLDKHAVALQDAQRAIRIVRSRAKEFQIDPDQIGVLGFSAGGNLATLTVHRSGASSYQSIDSIDEASAAPDFAVLIYPAYLMAAGKDHELDALIAPLKSRDDHPPIYMAVAADDRFATDSLHYLLQLHEEKVPAELHVYASGGHGQGLRETGGPFAQWTKSCARWLADLKHGTPQPVVD